MRRDLTDPAGGFYSAEDADSVPPEEAGTTRAHKMEGAFYVWPTRRSGTLLGADAERLPRCASACVPGGNAPFDPQEEFTNKNLLYTARPLDEVAVATGGRVAGGGGRTAARARSGCSMPRERRARGRTSTTRC